MGGRKAVFRSKGYRDLVTLEGKATPAGQESLLKPIIKGGKITSPFRDIDEIRSRTMKEIKAVARAEPSLRWA